MEVYVFEDDVFSFQCLKNDLQRTDDIHHYLFLRPCYLLNIAAPYMNLLRAMTEKILGF